MKRLSKRIILLIVLLGVSFIPVGTVKAALQSNPNTHVKKADALANWMTNMRNMEKSGEAMGLSEKLNSDLTTDGDSNKIDVHMMKSTEYGAIAILSASGYGNSQTLQASEVKTTTGNKTGIYFTGSNWEYVAGVLEGNIPTGVNPIYYNEYTGDSNITKVGDALGTQTTSNPGCRGWHSASHSYWIYGSYPYFVRGSGGLFSCYYNYGAYSYGNYCGRGVAVCGEGL